MSRNCQLSGVRDTKLRYREIWDAEDETKIKRYEIIVAGCWKWIRNKKEEIKN